MAAEKIAQSGLRRYEISNYSRPGFECRHNLNVWRGATYLGLGPAASSFDGVDRWSQLRDLPAWLNGAECERDIVDKNTRLAEVLAFGFRTTAGWQINELESLYDVNVLKLFDGVFRELVELGVVYRDEQSLRPTAKGLLFADTIAEALLF